MKSITNTWQSKVYRLINSSDNSVIKRDVSPVVFDKNVSPFQASTFAYLFCALERLVRNKLLVGGFPKYVVYGCRIKSEDNDVCVAQFHLSLNTEYAKSTSTILLAADKLMTQTVYVEVRANVNAVKVTYGNNLEIFDCLTTAKQYDEMANKILPYFIVDSMKKEKVTK